MRLRTLQTQTTIVNTVKLLYYRHFLKKKYSHEQRTTTKRRKRCDVRWNTGTIRPRNTVVPVSCAVFLVSHSEQHSPQSSPRVAFVACVSVFQRLCFSQKCTCGSRRCHELIVMKYRESAAQSKYCLRSDNMLLSRCKTKIYTAAFSWESCKTAVRDMKPSKISFARHGNVKADEFISKVHSRVIS